MLEDKTQLYFHLSFLLGVEMRAAVPFEFTSCKNLQYILCNAVMKGRVLKGESKR